MAAKLRLVGDVRTALNARAPPGCLAEPLAPPPPRNWPESPAVDEREGATERPGFSGRAGSPPAPLPTRRPLHSVALLRGFCSARATPPRRTSRRAGATQ